MPHDHVVTKSFYLHRRLRRPHDDRPDLDRGVAAARSRRHVACIRRAPATAFRRSSSPRTIWRAPGPPTANGSAAVPARSRRRAPARTQPARRRQSRDVYADRQLQGRSGSCARSHRKAFALNAYSIAFSPLLPWPLLIVLRRRRAGRLRRDVVRAVRRGGVLRLLAFALLLLEPARSLAGSRGSPPAEGCRRGRDRSIGQPDRSATAPRRPTHARAELEKRLGALDNVETRVCREPASPTPTIRARGCFRRCNPALSDVPSDRIGAAILVTDGIVHDIPADRRRARLQGAAARADHRPCGRARPPHRTGRGAALRHCRQGPDDQRARARHRRFGRAGRAEVRRDGERIATLNAAIGADHQRQGADRARRAQCLRTRSRAAAGRIDRRSTTRAVVTVEGVRDKLRVLLVSGEPHQGERMWRNLLKSDANVDLVHFTILRPPEKSSDGTPINELSLIAFPVADLFGRKIKRFRSDHLRSLFQPEHSAASLFQQYRRLCARRRRLADGRGARFRDAGGALSSRRSASSRRPSPTGDDRRTAPSAPIISPDGAKHPVTRGLAGARTSPPAWGPWFRQIGAEVTSGVNILSGADNKPLLVLSRADKGRVALAAQRPDVALGARLSRAAARISICCAVSPIG